MKHKPILVDMKILKDLGFRQSNKKKYKEDNVYVWSRSDEVFIIYNDVDDKYIQGGTTAYINGVGLTLKDLIMHMERVSYQRGRSES